MQATDSLPTLGFYVVRTVFGYRYNCRYLLTIVDPRVLPPVPFRRQQTGLFKLIHLCNIKTTHRLIRLPVPRGRQHRSKKMCFDEEAPIGSLTRTPLFKCCLFWGYAEVGEHAGGGWLHARGVE